jgi:catechol 2,3-dioxygenase-like lactoylglutathione lyase family enzyme
MSEDPRKTAQWFIDMFGARPLEERTVRGVHIVPVALGDVQINNSTSQVGRFMGAAGEDLRQGLEHIAITTEDLEADLTKLRKQGWNILETVETQIAKLAFIRGPGEVMIELIQPLD